MFTPYLGVIVGVGTMYLLRDKKISELAKEIRARRTENVLATAKIKL